MNLSYEEKQRLIEELLLELHGKLDGSRKNIIVPECVWCGKKNGKMGIYVGPETERKKPFMAHCFSCGHSTQTLEQLLQEIGRMDLMVVETFDFKEAKHLDDFSFMEDEQELDDELCIVDMPECFKRTYRNKYLDKRGFVEDDYEYFPVGTTRGLNFKFDDYVIFPIIDSGDYVGYVSRHVWSKADIDEYNRRARHNGKYQILRYRNSNDNDFVKLLYNYDMVEAGVTDTVILVEGIFDVIALTRKLNLYDNHRVVVCATFGKKISDVQIYKLQSKGVETIVVGYDGDASESISKTAATLSDYFEHVYIADIEDPDADFDSMDFWDVYDTFAYNLKSVTEYKLQKIQL